MCANNNIGLFKSKREGKNKNKNKMNLKKISIVQEKKKLL